jgi:hypothetical protein
MKPFKMIASIVGVLVGLGVASSIQAQEKEISSDKLELKLLWSKKLPEENVRFTMTDDGQVVLRRPYKEGTETVGEEIQFIDEKGNVTKRFHAKTEVKVQGPPHMRRVWFNGMSRNGKYFLFRRPLAEVPEGPQQYSYYTADGKRLWSQKIDAESIRLSPDGEYLGYSSILNDSFPGGMDWWELRDKNFNLIWKYQPKWQFNAVVLNGGRMLMVEGNKVKILDKGGNVVKDVLIPALTPYKLSYQFGAVLPMKGVGPDRLVTTSDGRYVAFVYSQYNEKVKEWWWTLYSVDMGTGKWWSYLVEGGSHISWTNAIGLTGDGRYLLLYLEKGLFSFDNANGKLLWKDTTGWDIWDGSLLSRPEDVSELLALIVVRWGGGLSGAIEHGMRKREFIS